MPSMDTVVTSLGPVKPHVRPVAYEIAERFGPLYFIWGAPGRGTGDHAKGLALDFMVYELGGGVDSPGPIRHWLGDQIAGYVVDNHARLNASYVIWDRKIASPLSDPDWSWRPYDGSNPHIDHPHVSFEATGTYQPPDDTEEPMAIDRSDLDDFADRIEGHVTQRTYSRVNEREMERYGYSQPIYQAGRLVKDSSKNTREMLIRSVRLEAKVDLLIERIADGLTDNDLDAIQARVEIELDERGLLEDPDVGTVPEDDEENQS